MKYFCSKLYDVVKSVPKREKVVIGADFNNILFYFVQYFNPLYIVSYSILFFCFDDCNIVLSTFCHYPTNFQLGGHIKVYLISLNGNAGVGDEALGRYFVMEGNTERQMVVDFQKGWTWVW